MKTTLARLLSVAAIVSSSSSSSSLCSAFSVRHPSATTTTTTTTTPAVRRGGASCRPGALLRDDADYCNEPATTAPGSHGQSSRRSAIVSTLASIQTTTLGIILASSSSSLSNPLPAYADADADAAGKKGKVVVFGGSGWVGAHVSADLAKLGYEVVSISRSSADDQIRRTESILGVGVGVATAQYVSLDAGTAAIDDLASAMTGSLAVISCVGISPGSPNVKDGNGVVNTRIAKAAKAAGVPRFVYVGVASSLANGPAKFLLGDYFKGKADAEKSVANEFGDANSLVIKPAIIAGGTPGEIRPPGPPGVKAADVDAVAKLAVAGALGNLKGIIDGNENIAAMAASSSSSAP